MREWALRHDSLWSCRLLHAESLRAAPRQGLTDDDVETVLEWASLIMPIVATFSSWGHYAPHSLRSLDALQPATALKMGNDIEGFVTYDDHLTTASSEVSLVVEGPV